LYCKTSVNIKAKNYARANGSPATTTGRNRDRPRLNRLQQDSPRTNSRRSGTPTIVTDQDRDRSPSVRPLRGLLDDILSFCAYFWTFLSFRSQQRINKTLKVVSSPEKKTQVLENMIDQINVNIVSEWDRLILFLDI
jgi:hypothetical protein